MVYTKYSRVLILSIRTLEYLVYTISKIHISSLSTSTNHREKNTLEPKAECYANDKVKSPPVSDHFTTISSNFFDNYHYIFHKNEVLTVILRGWTGLNLNWFKSYDTKRKWSDKHAVLIVGVRFRLCSSFSVVLIST